MIQKECTSALEDLDNERLQIKIDSIDRRTWEKLNQLIDSLIKVKDGINENKKVKA
jgi:hypothetical protein